MILFFNETSVQGTINKTSWYILKSPDSSDLSSTNILWSSVGDTTNLLKIVANATLTPSTTYYAYAIAEVTNQSNVVTSINMDVKPFLTEDVQVIISNGIIDVVEEPYINITSNVQSGNLSLVFNEIRPAGTTLGFNHVHVYDLNRTLLSHKKSNTQTVTFTEAELITMGYISGAGILIKFHTVSNSGVSSLVRSRYIYGLSSPPSLLGKFRNVSHNRDFPVILSDISYTIKDIRVFKDNALVHVVPDGVYVIAKNTLEKGETYKLKLAIEGNSGNTYSISHYINTIEYNGAFEIDEEYVYGPVSETTLTPRTDNLIGEVSEEVSLGGFIERNTLNRLTLRPVNDYLLTTPLSPISQTVLNGSKILFSRMVKDDLLLIVTEDAFAFSRVDYINQTVDVSVMTYSLLGMTVNGDNHQITYDTDKDRLLFISGGNLRSMNIISLTLSTITSTTNTGLIYIGSGKTLLIGGSNGDVNVYDNTTGLITKVSGLSGPDATSSVRTFIDKTGNALIYINATKKLKRYIVNRGVIEDVFTFPLSAINFISFKNGSIAISTSDKLYNLE